MSTVVGLRKPELPEGSHRAVICDVVDIGTHEIDFQGEKSLSSQLMIFYETDIRIQEGEYAGQRAVKYEYLKKSFHPRSTLTKRLETFLGRGLTNAELINGYDLKQLIGKNVTIVISHTLSPNRDKIYSKITQVLPAPKDGNDIVPENKQAPAWVREKIDQSLEAKIKKQSNGDPVVESALKIFGGGTVVENPPSTTAPITTPKTEQESLDMIIEQEPQKTYYD